MQEIKTLTNRDAYMLPDKIEIVTWQPLRDKNGRRMRRPSVVSRSYSTGFEHTQPVAQNTAETAAKLLKI